jgi:hypothetical protein
LEGAKYQRATQACDQSKTKDKKSSDAFERVVERMVKPKPKAKKMKEAT